MHIVMFSMTPLFADRSMGGAQKQLKKVAVYLAEQGHRVTLLCTWRGDAREPFQWHENAQILPIYHFKQPFPEPYDVPPYLVAQAIQDTAEYLAKADVFYSHDGGLIFPYIYQDIPAVISLRSVRFSETIQSGFLFQGDTLIVPSEHTADVWRYTTGQFFPEMKQRIKVIHNGLDFSVYKPTDPTELAARIGVDPQKHAIVLYPHRPEENKGIHHAIRVASELVEDYALKNLRLLIPRWIDTGLSADVRAFYDSLMEEIREAGIMDNVIFHDWISDTDMPAYYSLGGVTLAIGSYVETFGNTPYESLACGTPVIAARVAAYRDMLPPEYLVNYSDVPYEAAERAASLLAQKARTSDSVMEWLHTNFSQDDMVRRYADIILEARKQAPMVYRPTLFTEETQFVLAPWCYVTEDGAVYHDFRGQYISTSADVALLRQTPVRQSDGASGQVDSLYRTGYLVPLID
jgi:glycosyltransferase involved in cell wall biosynthesis